MRNLSISIKITKAYNLQASKVVSRKLFCSYTFRAAKYCMSVVTHCGIINKGKRMEGTLIYTKGRLLNYYARIRTADY